MSGGEAYFRESDYSFMYGRIKDFHISSELTNNVRDIALQRIKTAVDFCSHFTSIKANIFKVSGFPLSLRYECFFPPRSICSNVNCSDFRSQRLCRIELDF